MTTASHDHKRLNDWRALWWAVWCIAGIGAVVLAYYQGVQAWINPLLREALASHPVGLAADAFTPDPLVMLLAAIGVTLLFTYVIIATPGFWRRLLIWMAVLVLAALCTPVLAMWGVFFSAVSVVLAMAVAGFGALITALFLRHEPA